MSDQVHVAHDPDLVATLDALDITWDEVQAPNGSAGIIAVRVDDGVDARLLALVDRLSALRWRYRSGRMLQLRLPGDEEATSWHS